MKYKICEEILFAIVMDMEIIKIIENIEDKKNMSSKIKQFYGIRKERLVDIKEENIENGKIYLLLIYDKIIEDKEEKIKIANEEQEKQSKYPIIILDDESKKNLEKYIKIFSEK